MGMWTAIALICVAGIIGGAYSKRHENRSHKRSDEEMAQLQQRLDSLEQELRERVEVLERIVTDRKEDLKRQFDHLDKAS
jgi:uncharacterized membrane-anchored protein YhcB (DUF1043 family)